MEKEWSEMTPQQKRLEILNDSRNWGPFTHDQEEYLNSILRSTKRLTAPPDFIDRLRYADRVDWPHLQTIQMEGE